MKISDCEFDNILERILSEMTANQLLDIPGIYEIVSKYFNNEVLNEWKWEHELD